MQVRPFRIFQLAMSPKQSAVSKGVAPGGHFFFIVCVMTAYGILAVALPSAFTQTPFYQGKTVKIIAAGTPGGTADFRVRALVPFLRKHIPGNPTVVLEFMDGSGGRKAANYIYGNARPDGLTLGALSGGIVALQIMGESGVMYDVDKLIYLGSTEGGSHQIIYTRKELGLDSIEKLRAASGIRIGAESIGHVAHVSGRLFAYFIGMKDAKFIAGYTAPEVDAALLRGELDARSNNPTSVLRRNPEWLDQGVMNFHLDPRIAEGGQAPPLWPFARDRELRQVGKGDQAADVMALFQNDRLTVRFAAGHAPGAREDF